MCELETTAETLRLSEGKNAFSQGIPCCFGADAGTKMRKIFQEKSGNKDKCVLCYRFLFYSVGSSGFGDSEMAWMNA